MSWLQTVDVALFRFINQTLSHPVLDAVIPPFSGFPLFMPAVILLGVFLIWKGGPRERMFVLMLILVLSLGESFVIAPMKEMVGRLRPFNVISETHLLVGKGGSGSMPSSHTSNWFAATMVACFFYRRSWRFMLPLAAMVGFSRIYVGVHYPGDVLAGAVLGAGYACAFVWVLNRIWQQVGKEWFPRWYARMPSLVPQETVTEASKVPEAVAECKASGGRGGGPGLPELREVGFKTRPTGQGTDIEWLRFGYVLIGLFLLVQLIYLAGRTIELSGDEAYQWVWSKHLALSYYSKPPLIAYLQFLGTSIWGDNAFGVRFLSPVMGAIISLLLLRFFAREVNPKAGFWLVVIFQCTPLLGVGATLMTVDPPLCLFWVAAMMAGWRAVQPDSTARNWLWVGLWMGLGFLTKYSALFQLPCWAIFFLLWPAARQQLRRPGPYLALLVIGLSTIPVIVWNAQHDWITVDHVAYTNASLGQKWNPTPKFLGEFLGSMLGLLNPVFFCALVWACFAFWRRNRGNPLFVFMFSMGAPLFLFYLLFTAWKRVLPNWIAPSVVPLLCLMVLYFEQRWREGLNIKRWLTTGVVIGGIVFVALHDTNLTNKLFGRTLPVPLDPLRRVRAWASTAKPVGEARQKLLAEGKPVFIIGSHYMLAGQLSFYLPEAQEALKSKALVYCPTATKPENQFYFWPGYRQERPGENAIFVHELGLVKLSKGWFPKWLGGSNDIYQKDVQMHQDPPPEVMQEFESVTPIGVADIEYRGRIMRRLELFACRNLK